MRVVLSIIAAAFVSAALLLLMSSLISDEPMKSMTEPKPIEVDMVKLPEKEPPVQTKELEPPKPPVIERTPNHDGETIDTTEINSDAETFSVRAPEVSPIGIGKLGPVTGVEIRQNSEAFPMYRTQPNYPMVALQRGLEGWVLLRYDVDTSGSLSNIRVMDSEPRRIFDKEAMRALKKWKFKPALIDGQPVASTGQTVKIQFDMDQDSADN